MWQDWTSYRRFRKLPPHDRSIVFYSETHQDWHHLQPLIEFLTERLSRTVCHVTSEQSVPLPAGPAPACTPFASGRAPSARGSSRTSRRTSWC